MTNSEYLVPGAEVEFSGRGTIMSLPTETQAHIMVMDQQTGAQSHWFMNVKQMRLKAVPGRHRALKPGQVWETSDGLYMVRVSRADLPYRLTPADMSAETGLTTLDENSFFLKYPGARLVYKPGTKSESANGNHHKNGSLTPDHDAGNGNGHRRHQRRRRSGPDLLTWDTPAPYNMDLAPTKENS